MKYSIIRLFFYIAICSLFSACSLTTLPKQSTQKTENQIYKLSKSVIDLNNRVDKQEAKDFSSKAILYSNRLRKKYDIVSPPLWHNTMVNLGIRKRGLCHEWSSDLLKYFFKQSYKSLQFYFIGSDIGSYFEHNALAVSAKGDSLDNSIVIDAWRDSGFLYFKEIKEDKSYVWKNREDVYSRYHQ